jgi:subtilisin family serine protease
MKATPLRLARWILFALLCLLACGSLLAQTGAPNHRSDRILVKPKPGVDLTLLHAQLGSQVQRTYPDIQNLQVIQLPPLANPLTFIALYQQSGLVDYAEPDFVLYALRTPNDPHFASGFLWGLHNTGQLSGRADADIDAPEAWDARTEAPNVIVAVIDTGGRYTHEDLAVNMWVNPGESGRDFLGLDKRNNLLDDDGNGYLNDMHGINAITGTGNPLDDHGHGTHVSGTIGGAGNNNVGVVGVAWRVQMMELKFLDALGQGFNSDAIECIDYARRNGAKIISASWGGYDFDSTALRDAIASTRDAGMIFVAAAANDASDNDTRPLYPASYDLDNVISVAATTRRDELASFSNFGATTVDLGAPGEDIYSTWNLTDSAYQYLSGTSMATPHVSGACALVWARYPDESYLQIKNRILAGTDPLPTLAGKCVTGGRLNLQKALGSTTPQPTQPVVTVSAGDPSATESGDPGRFTIMRTGSTASSLTVDYTVSGTAQNGVDYQVLTGLVTIPGGSSSANLTVTPVDDPVAEGNETVVLTIAAGSAHTVGSPASATVTIADNDSTVFSPIFGGILRVNSTLLNSTASPEFQIRLLGDPQQTYVLEASTDLSHWTAIATNQATGDGALHFTDPHASRFTARFYRTFIPVNSATD